MQHRAKGVTDRYCGVSIMGHKPLRIGWVGFHQEGIRALRSVLRVGYQVRGVVTLTESLRGKRSAAANYETICRQYGVPLRAVEHINHPESVAWLQALNPDILFVIGWSQILSAEVLSIPRLGAIGAHASLLPHNRGSAPVNWALIRGETTTGNSLIWLAEGVDEGDVIDQTTISIDPYATCETVYKKVATSNARMILRLLPELARGLRPGNPQAPGDDPVLPRRRPQDGGIDWSRPASEVYDFIRALTRPYPGAFSGLEGETMTCWKAALLPTEAALGEPGAVIGPVYSPVKTACGQLVACGRGAVVVLEVEKRGGRVLRGPTLSNQNWMRKTFKTYV